MMPELATDLAGRIRIEAQVESTGGLVKVEATGPVRRSCRCRPHEGGAMQLQITREGKQDE
jgi:hypothetical protein